MQGVLIILNLMLLLI